MIEYLVLFAVFVGLSFYTRWKGEAVSKKTLTVINLVCFSCTLILLMCRHETMGSDLSGVEWIGYLRFFDRVASQSFKEALFTARHFEFGFTLFVKLVSLIWWNQRFYLAVTAFVSLLPIALMIGRKSEDPAFSWIIYTSLMPFMLLYSGLRQGTAIGLAVVAFIFAEEKRPVWFVLAAVAAFSFHVSAALVFLLYPLTAIRIAKKWRFATIAALPLAVVFCRFAIKVAVSKFPKYEYLLTEGGGSYRYFLMLLAVYIFCCVFTDESSFQNACLNVFFAACAFQMLGIFSQTAPRAGFYFTPVLSVLYPDVIRKIENRRIASLSYYGGVVCFTLLAFYIIYTTDWAMAYPYHWFWDKIA